MKLFNLFKKTTIIQDDFFGTLRYITFKDSNQNYFEGKGKFKATNCEIEYSIDGELSGPTTDQKDFYKRIEIMYDQITPKIITLILSELQKIKPDFEIKHFRQEFKLVGLTIPKLTSKPLIWDMSFDITHDLDHQVTINFEDFEPKTVLIDG